MKKVKCPKCKYKWVYLGTSIYYITCPRCYSKFNLQKSKEKKKEKENVKSKRK